MRKALVAPQTGRQLSFPLRTPNYAENLALLFVGFFHAADDNGEDLRQNSSIRARSGLQLPVGADESYELSVAFTRLSGNQSLNLRVPIGNRHPDIVVGGYPDYGHASVIRLINAPQPDGRRNPTWTVGSALESNRRYLLNLQVRLRSSNSTSRRKLRRQFGADAGRWPLQD